MEAFGAVAVSPVPGILRIIVAEGRVILMVAPAGSPLAASTASRKLINPSAPGVPANAAMLEVFPSTTSAVAVTVIL